MSCRKVEALRRRLTMSRSSGLPTASAFTFTLAAQQPSLHGIVLVNRDGGSEQVVLQRQPSSETLDIDWDLLSHPVVHPAPERSLPQNLCSVY